MINIQFTYSIVLKFSHSSILIISVLIISGFSFNEILALEDISGNIVLDQNQITLYRGNTIPFQITAEISDHKYKPELEIFYKDNLVQKIQLSSIGDTFYSTIGLNENWSSGIYTINLKYQNQILDSEQFVISRDNEIEQEITIQEEPVLVAQPYISLSIDELFLENLFYEVIPITGNIHSTNYGHVVSVNVIKPDETVYTTYAFPNSDGFFSTVILVDKYWITGEYSVYATYLKQQTDSQIFTIQNNWATTVFSESQLVGSFEITSEISHDYTILGVSGEIDTDETEISLFIEKEDVVMYQDTIPLNDKNFETSFVLYDYEKNSPWEYGEYKIRGMIGKQEFNSKEFTLDEQAFTVPQNQNMDLFMKMTGEMEKMVDRFEVEITEGKSEQVILYGTLEEYHSGDSVTVHLVNPEGKDTESHLIASESGAYYMPIIVDDSWISGQYTAYVTYGDFVDEPSSFSVINHAMVSEEVIVDDTVAVEDDIIEIKNYSISFSDTQSSSSVHYVTTMDSYSGKTPITLSLDDKIISELFAYSGDDGVIDYYLLLDYTWSAGNYTVSYIESNIAVPFGTFEILGNDNDVVEGITEDITSEIIHTTLSLDKTTFKTSSHFVNTVSFSGDADYSGNIAVSLDGEIISHVNANSDGEYEGIIFLSDKLDAGFHNVSVQYGEKIESAEFLIATNDAIPLTEDITISKSTIAESGGTITISVSGIMDDFVPSTIQPLFIDVSGVESQKFSLMPKMYGHYLQNFVIDDTLGDYTITVSYDGEILKSHSISVIPAELSWVKSHTESLINGETNYVSYLNKAVLMLDEPYAVHSDVVCPEWFAETAEMWVNGAMSDDSFYDAVQFLADGLQ